MLMLSLTTEVICLVCMKDHVITKTVVTVGPLGSNIVSMN